MSLIATIKNPNRGPLKLKHDITPRDLAQYNPSTDNIPPTSTYAYRGFPANNFQHGRSRPAVPNPAAKDHQQSPREGFHGLPHHLDTRKPLDVGKAEVFQYGSDRIADNRSTTRTPHIATKTSAELRRFHHQQEQTELDIKMLKAEKQAKMNEREQEKREDLEMLKSYNPWGKAGGGAPRQLGGHAVHKKTKLDDNELFNKDYTSPRKNELMEEYGDFHSYFGKPGYGAPIRTDSGKLKTELKGDTAIRFQDSQKGRAVYNQELRYQQPGENKHKYHQELEKQVETSRLSKQEQRLDDLRKELDMLQHHPYGRPGAGAPNKSKSGQHTVAGRRITLSNDLAERRRAHQKEMERDTSVNRANSDAEIYDPWGKGAGHPIRNKHGEVRRHRHADGILGEPVTETALHRPNSEEGTSLQLPASQGGAGAPMKTDSGRVKTRMPITMRRDEKGDVTMREEMPAGLSKRGPLVLDDPELAVYDPYGRAGAGAPLRDRHGKIKTNIYGNLRQDAVERSSETVMRQKAKQQYLDELQREMVEQKKLRSSFDDNKTGGVEFASIIRNGKVGKPRRDPDTGTLVGQHLATTDVTKQKTQERPQRSEQSQAYHTELDAAAQNRKQLHQLDRLRDKQEDKHHQDEMNKFWGRPGGGAPNQSTKKANLDDILYSPRKEANDFYNKNVISNQRPNNYVRNTVNSMHQNMYEFNTPQRPAPKKAYNLMTPWAISAEEAF